MITLTALWTIIAVGVDYLTLTAKEDHARQKLLYWAEKLSSINERNGGQRKPWKSQGYDGWKCGAITYGWREDSAIMKWSGAVNPEFFGEFNWNGVNCTRIDVQVTARTSHKWPLYGKGAMEQAEWDREMLKGTPQDKNWPKIKRWDGRGEGDTIQTGSRSSMRFGRLYDKGEQSGLEEWHNCWRWEVEYKEEMAPIVLQRVTDGGASIDVIASVVAGQYIEWGFKLPWEYHEGDCVDGPGRPESDAQRKLRWLKKQVRPTVVWLIENGHLDKVEDIML